MTHHTVYKSAIDYPHLPRTSVFNYLFPQDGPDVGAARDKKALIDALTGRSVTKLEVYTQAVALAGGLAKLGVGSGDVACLFGTNSLEWMNACFGCQARGVIVSPANYAYTASELLHQMKDSTTKIVFVAPPLLPSLLTALSSSPSTYTLSPERIILLTPKSSKPEHLAKYACTEDLWVLGAGVDGRMEWKDGDEEKTAYLCYSSGTTGRGKGVETSHWNMTSQLQAVNVSMDKQREDDVFLGVLPFGHIYALTLLVHRPLTANVPVVILSRFEPTPVLEAIQRFGITFIYIVPPILLFFVQSTVTAQYTLTSLRRVHSAAAPLSSEMIAAFERKLPHATVTQAYGLTETSPIATNMNLEDVRSHKGKVGRLIATFEARLVDTETGEDVQRGAQENGTAEDDGGRGELWLRGPSVMKGYWRNEEATRGAFKDGWFKTGDVATVDAEGYFAIVDREKELIKYKGFQVPPAELEALLLTHEEIMDVAVIGVYDERQATELPRAYVVPKTGIASLTPNDRVAFSKAVEEWVESRVSNHKKLRGGVCLVDTIPKSPSGKILRKNLRAVAGVMGRGAKL